MANTTAAKVEHWDAQYREERPVWDLDEPCSELCRVLAAEGLHPRTAVELGCGSGASSVWLAEQGIEVTGIDLSPTAIERARQRAAAAGVKVHFIAGDLEKPELLQGPYDFFFDGGCYHALRRNAAAGYFRTLERITHPGTVGLVLTGNADEPADREGPPELRREEIEREWGRCFEVLQLRPFRFDSPPGVKRYLGWSCLVRR